MPLYSMTYVLFVIYLFLLFLEGLSSPQHWRCMHPETGMNAAKYKNVDLLKT